MNLAKFIKAYGKIAWEIEVRTEKFHEKSLLGYSAEMERQVILRRIPVLRAMLTELEEHLQGEGNDNEQL